MAKLNFVYSGVAAASLIFLSCGTSTDGDGKGAGGTGRRPPPPRGSGSDAGTESSSETPAARPAPGADDAVPGAPSPAPAPDQGTTLAAGIYFGVPDAAGEHVTLARAGTPLVIQHTLPEGGFDVARDAIVYAENTASGARLVLGSPDGKARRVIPLRGVFQASAAALSPDGRTVAFTARLDANRERTEDLDVFVTEIAAADDDGVVPTRLSRLPASEAAPRWFPLVHRLAYAVRGATPGIRVVDTDSGKELLAIPTSAAPGGVAVSKDGKRLLVPALGRIYDATAGSLVADFLASLRAGAVAQTLTLGEFPRSGDFSPDGTRLVLEGAATADGETGSVVVTCGADGKALEIVAGPLGEAAATPIWVP